MKYDFYVNDEGTWYGVYSECDSYVCVEQDSNTPYATTYPINCDPTNWINTVQRHADKGQQ